jgi:hypothetical protein
MRRLLSIFLVVCLFNVSVHSAVADLAAVTAPEHHSVLVPQEANSKTKTVVDHLRSKISHTCSAIKDSFNTVTQTPTGFVITFMGMTVVAIYAFLCTMVLLQSFMDGHSFSVQHTLFFSRPHTSFAIPDTCANPYFLSDHNRDLQIYQHLTQGQLSLTEFIPLCLNNAHHLMGLLGGAILQKLYHEYSGNNWWPFQEGAFNLLVAHGMPLRPDTISCDVKLAYGGEPDQIVNCQFEPLPDFLQNSVIAPNAHAKLWLIKAWHQPLDKNSLQLVVGSRPAEHLYLKSDTSPDYDRVDHHTRNEARRRMMQVMGMSLPEAIKDWFENALHWMSQAHDIATTLQAHQCPQPELSQALHNLTSSIFDAQQAVMNGTVRCDLRTENQSLQIHGCAFDEKPTGYNQSTLCDTNANVQFPEMGALWLLPRQEAYSTFVISMRPHRATPAPTPIPTTPVPTPEPQTPLPSTAEPTTSAPTQIPTTAEPTLAPTFVPTTVAPAKNTTTRLYWSNYAANEIWVTEINQTDGTAINPTLFIKGIAAFGLHVDKPNNKLYWTDRTNIYHGVVNLTSKTVYSQSTITLNRTNARINNLQFFPETLMFVLGYIDGVLLGEFNQNTDTIQVIRQYRLPSTTPIVDIKFCPSANKLYWSNTDSLSVSEIISTDINAKSLWTAGKIPCTYSTGGIHGIWIDCIRDLAYLNFQVTSNDCFPEISAGDVLAMTSFNQSQSYSMRGLKFLIKTAATSGVFVNHEME